MIFRMIVVAWFFIAATKSFAWNDKGFFSIQPAIGVAELPADEVRYPLIGFTAGQVFTDKSMAGFRWYLGADAGFSNDNITAGIVVANGEARRTFGSVLMGFDGLIFLGTKVAAFDIGPIISYNRYEVDVKVSNKYANSYSDDYMSFGVNLGFSFYITNSFGMKFGTRMMYPIHMGNGYSELESEYFGEGYLGFDIYF